VSASQAENHPKNFVQIPWNQLIGEGLLRYGFREAATQLTTRLMAAITQNLTHHKAFYRHYHAQTGQGIGERNSLRGLAPLKLFLNTVGIRIISSQKVFLEGYNPFPWPVTVRYRGLTVTRDATQTEIIFPGGQTIQSDSSDPQLITIEK
jgi:hypothetical protein